MQINKVSNYTQFCGVKNIHTNKSPNEQTFKSNDEQIHEQKNKLKYVLMTLGAITGVVGLGLDFAKIKVNEYIPILLDAIGGVMVASSFFMKNEK